MHANGSWEFGEGDEIVAGRHATRLLGGGHRYEAYLAWDNAMAALVVVKIVRPGLLDDLAARVGMEQEAQALVALGHPAIVRAFDTVPQGDRPHLVLEYLDGPRLSTLIRRFGTIVEQVLPLALELCSALHYMHGRGFVHLDVKPRNVVMSARPRLIDLSVARRLDALGDIKRPVGTDAYMSPEQCSPARFDEIGPASDVWGLGATLYEALARRQAFPSAATGEFPQLDTDPEPLPGGVPQTLADAVLSCLDREPALRPSPLELAEALEPVVANLPGPRLGLFRPGSRAHATRLSLR